VGKGFVLVDYGHNPEAILAVGQMASRWGGRKVTGVIALPGDRSDDMLQMAAEAAAASFDKLLIREDLDLRERKPGEVASIVLAAARGRCADCCVELEGAAAFRRAVSEMEAGELVVYFYDDIELMKSLLQQSGAAAVEDFRELEARLHSEVAA
jgi:cyanophycin synthetase